MTHEQASELLAAFALDALDLDEARAVSTHLQSCAQCQSMLASLREVTEQLASGVEQVLPPLGLREAVLSRTRARSYVIMLTREWAVGLAAAIVLFLVVLAGLAISLNRLGALAARLGTQEQALTLLANPSSRSVSLIGNVAGAVRLIYDPDRGRGALVVSGLQDPGRQFVYQLWLIAGTHPESAGVFRPAGQSIVVPVTADFTRYQAIAVSVERGPAGAPQPTTTPILIGKI